MEYSIHTDPVVRALPAYVRLVYIALFSVPENTALPGLILAGTYRRRGDRTFVYWTRSTIPVQINLDGSGTYNRVIIGIKGTKEDADALAERINLAITGC